MREIMLHSGAFFSRLFRPHLALAVSVAALSSACVTTREEGEQIRQDIAALKGEVAQSRAESAETKADQQRALTALQQRVEDLETTLRGLRQADADNGVQMEKVIAEVQVLRGDIEELQFKLGKTREELEGTKKSVKEVLERPPPTLHTVAEAPTVADEKSKGKTCGETPVPDGAQEHYDLAKSLFDKPDYAAAIDCFRQFTVAHEGAKQLLDNAWFWKGEAHYGLAGTLADKAREQEFKRAILAYQKVLEIPASNKQDGALLKVGLAFESLGFKDEARVFYEEVIAKHPKSPLVKQAKKRIDGLKEKKTKKKKRRRL